MIPGFLRQGFFGLRRIEKNTRSDAIPETIACTNATRIRLTHWPPPCRKDGPIFAATTGQAGTTWASAQSARPMRLQRVRRSRTSKNGFSPDGSETGPPKVVFVQGWSAIRGQGHRGHSHSAVS